MNLPRTFLPFVRPARSVCIHATRRRYIIGGADKTDGPSAVCRSAGINPCSGLPASEGQGNKTEVLAFSASPEKPKLLRKGSKCWFFALDELFVRLCRFRFYIFLNDALLICHPSASLPPEVGAIFKSGTEFSRESLPTFSFPHPSFQFHFIFLRRCDWKAPEGNK